MGECCSLESWHAVVDFNWRAKCWQLLETLFLSGSTDSCLLPFTGRVRFFQRTASLVHVTSTYMNLAGSSFHISLQQAQNKTTLAWFEVCEVSDADTGSVKGSGCTAAMTWAATAHSFQHSNSIHKWPNSARICVCFVCWNSKLWLKRLFPLCCVSMWIDWDHQMESRTHPARFRRGKTVLNAIRPHSAELQLAVQVPPHPQENVMFFEWTKHNSCTMFFKLCEQFYFHKFRAILGQIRGSCLAREEQCFAWLWIRPSSSTDGALRTSTAGNKKTSFWHSREWFHRSMSVLYLVSQLCSVWCSFSSQPLLKILVQKHWIGLKMVPTEARATNDQREHCGTLLCFAGRTTAQQCPLPIAVGITQRSLFQGPLGFGNQRISPWRTGRACERADRVARGVGEWTHAHLSPSKTTALLVLWDLSLWNGNQKNHAVNVQSLQASLFVAQAFG